MHPFEVYSSGVLCVSVHSQSCAIITTLILERFHHHKMRRNSSFSSNLLPSPRQPLIFCLYRFAFYGSFRQGNENEVTQYVVFCDYLLSRSVFSRFISVVVYISASFFFGEANNIPLMDMPHFL